MMYQLRDVSIALLFFLGTVCLHPAAAADKQGPRIPGVVPREVATGLVQFQNRMDPQQMLRLTLVLQPLRQDELQRFIDEVNAPNSPRFHRFLTFDEWKARFAPSDATVDMVDAWARSQGLAVIHRFRDNLALKVEGNAAMVESAFDLQLNHYTLGGRRFFSADRDPAIPAQVAGVLQDVQGLESFHRVHPANRALDALDDDEPIYHPGPFRGESRPFIPGKTVVEEVPFMTDLSGPQICCLFGGANGALEPPDLWSSQAYNLAALQRLSNCCNPTNALQGPTKETSIAIIGTNYANPSDLAAFFTQYGLTNLVVPVPINGPQCCDLEVTLDIEWAAAFSRSSTTPQNAATIYNYQGGGTLIADTLDAWHMALSDDSARIASTSFGAPEDKYGGIIGPSISNFTGVINNMAAMGWSIVAAAGDHGAYDNCQTLSVDFPASSPNVLAVGGTTLTLNNAGLFLTEVSWTGSGCGGSDWPGSNNGGGGGGCSVDTFVAPSWQPASATGCGNRRALPDIALNAGMPNGAAGISNQWIYYGGWITSGGTSIAAPEMAGFLAQTASYLQSLGPVCGPGPQHNAPCVPFGNPAPAIWIQGSTGPQGGAIADHNPFYDITNGCSGGSGGPPFMCAGPGYDRATGWGSVNMLQLAWTLISWAVNTPGGRAPSPQINWGFNPATNTWYNNNQVVGWQITSPNYPGSRASVGVAGFTAQWDAVVIDSISKPTPGSGDGFYSGPQTLASSGSLSLKTAGLGCHTAHVRGWDNTGQVTFDETYGPLCYDNLPPSVTCAAADGLWHATDVAISCSASDQPNLSGLANLADATFVLSTHVPAGTETANAQTDTRQVFDKAGNVTTAGPVGGNMVDKKPPTIAITVPTSTQYFVQQVVTADYACADGGSGLKSCVGTVSNGSPIDTATVGSKTFSVNATDNVSNASSQSIDYAVTYRICLQYDPTKPHAGRAYVIRLQICDASGANLSTQSIVLTATAVDGNPALAKPLGALNPGNTFLYGPESAPGASYLYNLDTQGLAAGTHTLNFTVQGDPTPHIAAFAVQ